MTDCAELVDLLEKTPHNELTVETASRRYVFRRMDDQQWVQEVTTLRTPVVLSGVVVDVRSVALSQSVQTHQQDGLVDVCAPLPGIFYRAPKPGAAPFVEIGARVGNDTVVGIIETMKLMNSVASGAIGEIAEICVENGAPVEARDIVMRVRPR